MRAHNHAPTEGPGLGCPETVLGQCLVQELTEIVNLMWMGHATLDPACERCARVKKFMEEELS